METQEETALEAIPHELLLQRDPGKEIESATIAAKALKSVIDSRDDKVVIRGKTFLRYEDWQTVGQFYGYSVQTDDAVACEIEGIKGAKAKAILLDRNGNLAGGAEAYCMRDEDKWEKSPWFQLASMAQTRAGAKALRNRLAWVAVLAGYSGTPAEEMDGVPHSDTRTEAINCPDCGGPMWDNRATKKGRQPDYKCKDKSCDKAVWLDSTTIDPQAAERLAFFNSIKSAGKTLNEMGDKPEWTLSRANGFANDNFNTSGGVDGLTVPQLAEMAKLLSSRIDSLKKKKPDPKVEVERQRIIKLCAETEPNLVTQVMNELNLEGPVTDLSLDALVLLQDRLFPF